MLVQCIHPDAGEERLPLAGHAEPGIAAPLPAPRLRKTGERHEAAKLRREPAAPVRRAGIANIGDAAIDAGLAVELPRRGQSPSRLAQNVPPSFPRDDRRHPVRIDVAAFEIARAVLQPPEEAPHRFDRRAVVEQIAYACLLIHGGQDRMFIRASRFRKGIRYKAARHAAGREALGRVAGVQCPWAPVSSSECGMTSPLSSSAAKIS